MAFFAPDPSAFFLDWDLADDSPRTSCFGVGPERGLFGHAPSGPRGNGKEGVVEGSLSGTKMDRFRDFLFGLMTHWRIVVEILRCIVRRAQQ